MEATYEQEASVNHFYDVITWDTQTKKKEQKKNFSKEKARWKNIKHLSCYRLANLKKREEQEIDRQSYTEPIERGVDIRYQNVLKSSTLIS